MAISRNRLSPPFFSSCRINRVRPYYIHPPSLFLFGLFPLVLVFILNFSSARRCSGEAAVAAATATANLANRFYANTPLFLFPLSMRRETASRRIRSTSCTSPYDRSIRKRLNRKPRGQAAIIVTFLLLLHRRHAKKK